MALVQIENEILVQMMGKFEEIQNQIQHVLNEIQAKEQKENGFLTVAQVAERYPFSRDWVYRNYQLLGGVKRSGKIFFKPDRIENYIEQGDFRKS